MVQIFSYQDFIFQTHCQMTHFAGEVGKKPISDPLLTRLWRNCRWFDISQDYSTSTHFPSERCGIVVLSRVINFFQRFWYQMLGQPSQAVHKKIAYPIISSVSERGSCLAWLLLHGLNFCCCCSLAVVIALAVKSPSPFSPTSKSTCHFLPPLSFFLLTLTFQWRETKCDDKKIWPLREIEMWR